LLHHARDSGSYSDQQLDKAVIKLMDPQKQPDAEKEREGKKGPYKRATIAHRELNKIQIGVRPAICDSVTLRFGSSNANSHSTLVKVLVCNAQHADAKGLQ